MNYTYREKIPCSNPKKGMVMSMAQYLKKKTFAKVMRGYSPEEVDAYIEYLLKKHGELSAENEENRRRLNAALQKIRLLSERESAAEQAVPQSNTEAERISERVKAQEQRILAEAAQKAEKIIRDAETEAQRKAVAVTAHVQRAAKEAESYAQAQYKAAQKIYTEVFAFRDKLFGMYNDHIELMETLAEEANTYFDTIDSAGALPVAEVELPSEDGVLVVPVESSMSYKAEVVLEVEQTNVAEPVEMDEAEVMTEPEPVEMDEAEVMAEPEPMEMDEAEVMAEPEPMEMDEAEVMTEPEPMEMDEAEVMAEPEPVEMDEAEVMTEPEPMEMDEAEVMAEPEPMEMDEAEDAAAEIPDKIWYSIADEKDSADEDFGISEDLLTDFKVSDLPDAEDGDAELAKYLGLMLDDTTDDEDELLLQHTMHRSVVRQPEPKPEKTTAPVTDSSVEKKGARDTADEDFGDFDAFLAQNGGISGDYSLTDEFDIVYSNRNSAKNMEEIVRQPLVAPEAPSNPKKRTKF